MPSPIPPREWKYVPSYIGHALQGALVVVGIVVGGPWMILALVSAVGYAVYQGLEFAKRRDTPGRDMGDWMGGLYLLTGLVVLLVWLRKKGWL